MTTLSVPRISFAPRAPFADALKSRVAAYFTSTGRSERGDWRLFAKTVFSYALLIGSYVSAIWWVQSGWGLLLAALGMVQGYVLIAFNVMHDGAHGSYSRRTWVNRLAGASMDFIGSSALLWRQKHNQLHHTYTNIDGKDDDLALGRLLRLSPQQPWHPWHRVQHWYAPLLYSLLTLYLAIYSDWHKLVTGRIGHTPLLPRKWTDVAYFLATKAFYVTYALVIPMLFHPAWLVLLVFFGIHALFGLTLSLVFQLAHIVEDLEFPQPDPANGRMATDWATHQVQTTADFAPRNRLATFYMGGLNFQVEHHLFHHVSHVHYPALHRIVRETCAEYGVPYRCFGTVREAVGSHFRFLRQMGRRPALALST
ncbi:acyl-CoA desaturase [Piscinibacter gummiphilus]|uniref:Acyl-CoA desaturase n=1 Tax=Piscinibacter gummiphilus TaxID=946333 RepID=A0ABZ0CUN0_9BURK|nr:acyl-CoA desaturase [Piscinibacter gummiphilus]WOB08675.1 acyl-CoA desaturase [Piscinibacter gummiphilus]